VGDKHASTSGDKEPPSPTSTSTTSTISGLFVLWNQLLSDIKALLPCTPAGKSHKDDDGRRPDAAGKAASERKVASGQTGESVHKHYVL